METYGTRDREENGVVESEEPELLSVDGIPRAFLDDGGSALRYVVRVWPLATVPTFFIAGTISALAHLSGHADLFDESQWDSLTSTSPLLLFFQVVVFAPVVETLMMALILALLRHFVSRPRTVALLSGAIWAALHSLSVPVWGLCIFWTFFVFSCVFMAWYRRSLVYAVGVTAAIHALNNLIAGLGLFLTPS